MNVVMVIQNFFPSIGGAERQAMTLACELVKTNVGVTVLTQNNGRSAARETIGGVKVLRMGDGVLSFMVTSFLWLIFHNRDYSVIHAHIGSSHAVAAALAGRLLSKKTIVKLSGSNIVGEIPVSRKSFFGRLKLRAFGLLKPVLVLVSPAQKQDLTGFGLESLQTFTIANGVDVQKFKPVSATERAELREKLEWTGAVFLFVGRFSADKLRLDIFRNLVSAWARLKAETAQRSFYLVGNGELEPAYRELIRSADVSGSFHLVPATENVKELYQAADVFVLPSVTEGLSNALLEAMACGLPVAASRVVGIQELIGENAQGRLFNPHSVEEIYQVLVGLLRDESARKRLGKAGVELAQRFSIENSVARHTALYQAA